MANTYTLLLVEDNPGDVLMIQLFQNLLSNSIKFRGPQNPVITIETRRKAHGWEFRFADNGIGISGNHKERIFEIFQRLHTGETYSGMDTGSLSGAVFNFTVPVRT